MKVIETALPGVLIIEPKVFGDSRGFFIETFQLERYREIGITQPFVQDNHSRSPHGVLRGLHFQKTRPQGKLVRVSRGAVYDVAVDVDPKSPTFGRYVGVELSDDNHRQVWIPPPMKVSGAHPTSTPFAFAVSSSLRRSARLALPSTVNMNISPSGVVMGASPPDRPGGRSPMTPDRRSLTCWRAQ